MAPSAPTGSDPEDASTRDVVAVGASAGGIEALVGLVGGLPADFPAAVLVVLHLPPAGGSALPRILHRASALPAASAEDGPLVRGRIYVAPPDHHLVVEPGRVRIVAGPREHGHRPAVDTLFRSAARAYRERVIGVILSGALDDGTTGLAAVKARGGLAVVQDPAEAAYPGMPSSAIANVEIDVVASLAEMPVVLDRLVRVPTAPAAGGVDASATAEPGTAPDGVPTQVALDRRLALRLQASGAAAVARRFGRGAVDTERQLEVVWRLLECHQPVPADEAHERRHAERTG